MPRSRSGQTGLVAHQDGPVVERYSTLEDDGDLPYGSGCGGVVYILLERRDTASPLLHALKSAFDVRKPLAIATVLEGPRIGAASVCDAAACQLEVQRAIQLATYLLQELAEEALERRASFEQKIPIDGKATRVWVDYRAARPGLWIFGAGDDARPLVRLARELGWFVAVADGRSHLATQSRFPTADEVRSLTISELPGSAKNLCLCCPPTPLCC